jgi:hypothetical protein
VLLVVPRVETLVRGQMPARQRRMLLDMAVFDSRVLRGVPRTGFRSLHSLVRHVDHSSCYYVGPDATPHSRAPGRDRRRSSNEGRIQRPSKVPVALLRRDRVNYQVELAAEFAGVAEQFGRDNEARVGLGGASPSWLSRVRRR